MRDRLRVMTVLGTRPEIIRLSRIIPALDTFFDHRLVHTGQNAAKNLSHVFFDELSIRPPDANLEIETQSIGLELSSLFLKFDYLLKRESPDRVLILGDTTSGTVAYLCARRGVPVYHMEAGNRCYDDRVPEEVNRRLIDHCSAVLLPYTHRSAANLEREGIARRRIAVIGNPIYEVLRHYAPYFEKATPRYTLRLDREQYILATLHRAENIDDPATLEGLSDALVAVADNFQMPLIFSVHPRAASEFTAARFAGTRVRPLPAMGFFDFVELEREAWLVLTDSGTVQEECAILGTPVLTLRAATERPETLEAGTNVVTSTDPKQIVAAAQTTGYRRALPRTPPAEYVEPNVSGKVVNVLMTSLEQWGL